MYSIFIACALLASSAPAPSLPLQDGTVVRLASREEAAALLGTRDSWVDAFGPFDLQLRLGTPDPVTEEEFLELAASSARDWEADAVEGMAAIVDSVRRRLELLELQLPLPGEILVIQTSGEEEGGADYTRGNAIVLVREDSLSVEEHMGLFLHELFHVMTRHEPGLRDPLYELIGFRPAPPLDYPTSLQPRKITNPDAFHFEHSIEVTAAGETHQAMVLTLSRTDRYEGGDLFDYVTISLLPVKTAGSRSQPVLMDGSPLLLDLGSVGGYFEQVGRNTQYIIHPEEIMAENFKMAVIGRDELPNPEIPAGVLRVLASTR